MSSSKKNAESMANKIKILFDFESPIAAVSEREARPYRETCCTWDGESGFGSAASEEGDTIVS